MVMVVELVMKFDTIKLMKPPSLYRPSLPALLFL
jgi:hypothetical protein